MRVQLLGSGTLRPDGLRGSPAHWIDEGGVKALLDCGAGSLRTLARLGLPWEGITHVLLSHFHTDHVGELAPLLFALKHGLERPRLAPLEILGPRGLEDHLRHLSAAHGGYVLDPGFPVEVTELTPGETRRLVPPSVGAAPGAEGGGVENGDGPPGEKGLELETRATRHTESSLAFRLQGPEGSVGYTGDTGPDPELGAFFRGCLLLVAECSHPDGHGMDFHLTPSGLAELAAVAAPELLVTVHAYPPLDPAEVPDLLARAGYTGRVVPGEDGLAVELGSRGPAVLAPPEV